MKLNNRTLALNIVLGCTPMYIETTYSCLRDPLLCVLPLGKSYIYKLSILF